MILGLFYLDVEINNAIILGAMLQVLIWIEQRFYMIEELITAQIHSFVLVKWTLFASIVAHIAFIAFQWNTIITTFFSEHSKIKWLFYNYFIWGKHYLWTRILDSRHATLLHLESFIEEIWTSEARQHSFWSCRCAFH